MIPARIMTRIGFILYFCKRTAEMMKIKTRLQWVLLRVMAVLLPQKAVVRMETPAAAIMATTAGRRVARTLWKMDKFLYLR